MLNLIIDDRYDRLLVYKHKATVFMFGFIRSPNVECFNFIIYTERVNGKIEALDVLSFLYLSTDPFSTTVIYKGKDKKVIAVYGSKGLVECSGKVRS